MFKKLIIFFSIPLLTLSCVGVYIPPTNTFTRTTPSVQTRVVTNFPEGFDDASKGRYEGGNIMVSSGQWYLENGMIGGADNDQKNGAKSVRMKEIAKLSMKFDIPAGIQQVRFKYGVYQLDKESSFELWSSTNGGASWNKVGSTTTATDKSLRDALFNVNIQQSARIEIRKTDGSANRLNIDEITLTTYGTASNDPTPTPNVSTKPTRDDNLALGNPSNAVTNTSYPDNYLMVKNAFTLSYNKNKSIANWVSWHLSAAWQGNTPRQNDFKPDSNLPQNWYEVKPTDYARTGFDRGHLCPSSDRDGTIEENQETFFMTNMTPQAPEHNQNIWKNLEEYERLLTEQGNEVYIIAGTIGEGGTGTNGFTKKIGKNNNITVPAFLWKIIVVLPVGQNDALRINENTRIIAVNIPNDNSAGTNSWKNYQVSINELERLTGYDFLSNVSVNIQVVIEGRIDK
jgi:endonuclease G